jgi:hypothetical protein
MSELDKPTQGSNASTEPGREGSPVWMVAVTFLLLAALIAWYRFK